MSGRRVSGQRVGARRVLALFLLVPAASCGPGAGGGPEGAEGGAADTVRASVGVTIGVVEGDPRYAFGDVTSVAADAAGRIYVADRIGSSIRVYAPDGTFLAQIGREGDGPGEFQWPADLVFGPDGVLYVRDAHRITRLAPQGEAGLADSLVGTWRLPGYGNLASRRSGVDTLGRYLYPYYSRREGEHFFLVFDDGIPLADTLKVPAHGGMEGTWRAFIQTSPGGGRLVEGLGRAPFAPAPAWAVTREATVLSGDGRSYELVETDLRGDTVGRIARDVPLRAVPAAEREDSARVLRARIDSLPVPLARVEGVAREIREGELPGTLPSFLSVHLSADGFVWVERWPPGGQGEHRYFDVLDRSGHLRRVVILPAPLETDPPPFFAADAVVGVTTDPETGVDRVVRLSLEPPAP